MTPSSYLMRVIFAVSIFEELRTNLRKSFYSMLLFVDIFKMNTRNVLLDDLCANSVLTNLYL